MPLVKVTARIAFITTMLLALLFVLSILPSVDKALAYEGDSDLLPADVVEMSAASASKVTDVALEGFDLPKGTLNGTYGGKRRVVVVGRASCSNTQSAVSQIARLAVKEQYKDVQFFVFDCDGDRKAFAEAYSSKQSANIRLCTPAVGSSTNYSNWARANYSAYFGFSQDDSSISLPWLFVIGEDGSILRATTGPQTVEHIVDDGFDGPPVGDSLITAHVSGTYHVTEAQMILDLVNNERAQAGASAVKWDSALELAAKQRAAELAVSYGHVRPDGSSCFSALPSEYSGTCAENIACGYRLWSYQANTSWRDSPGHYSNMVSKSYKSMGAACFKAVDGKNYWVECFSGKGGDGQKSDGGEFDTTTSVTGKSSVLAASLTVSYSGGYYLDDEWVVATRHKDGYTDFADVVFWSGNIDVTDFTWRSSDSSIVEVIGVQPNKGMLVQGVSPGTATILVENNANPEIKFTRTVPVEVSNDRDIRGATIVVEDQEYTGKPVEPKPQVMIRSWPLTESRDYVVSYSNNTNAGTATITITGVGDYFYSKTASFNIKAKSASPQASASGSQAMYRLYNPNSGEHFYTASAEERDNVKAAGWNYEGEGWKAPVKSNTPVYRVYNKYGGEHHYTTSKSERDSLVKAGWNDEGIGWYSDDEQRTPLYRQYNPNQFACNHNYTTSKEENDYLVSIGWKYEGEAWYGV